MTEADEVAASMLEIALDCGLAPWSPDNKLRAFVRRMMPDESVTVIDNTAEALRLRLCE